MAKVERELAGLLEADGDARADRRLHPAEPPIRLGRMANDDTGSEVHRHGRRIAAGTFRVN